ncbi:hypothetical protein CNECB9_4260011 [Cupriavidus necator]|uniref:Uncharacterized protein n=1 Tax=Cupriavidus necator TaxID=106590 RepID=A0A1K0JFU1_CUPNE|nr:hypothetical protein CNECB9_4260011 [Cupriavidus necator]
MREGVLHSHGIRQAHPHRSEAAGVDPAPGLVETVELRGPHLMLAHVGADMGVAAGQLPDLFDNVLRLDGAPIAGVRQAFPSAPRIDLGPPGRPAGQVDGLPPQDCQQVLQYPLHVTDDWHRRLDALRNGRRVDINVDDLPVARAEILHVADHAIIEARADRDQDIALLHRPVCFIGAMHPEHAQEASVSARKRAESHEGVRHRRIDQGSQREQLGTHTRRNDAATAINTGLSGAPDYLRSMPDLTPMAFHHGPVGADLHMIRVGERRAGKCHVLRDIDHDRPRASRSGKVKGLDGQCQTGNMANHKVVLDDWPGNADRIAFLECILPNQRGRNIAGDDHHRNRVEIGSGNACNGIGNTRPGCHQRNTHLAGGSGVPVCGVDGRLLMANQQMLHIVLPVQGVVDWKHSAARISPDCANSFEAERLDDHFGTAHMVASGVPLSGTTELGNWHIHARGVQKVCRARALVR